MADPIFSLGLCQESKPSPSLESALIALCKIDDPGYYDLRVAHTPIVYSRQRHRLLSLAIPASQLTIMGIGPRVYA